MCYINLRLIYLLTYTYLHHSSGDDWRPAAVALYTNAFSKGAITSKIKCNKLKTSHASTARLAQLLQPSLAFCFSLQPMTPAYRPGLDGTPSLAAS